MICGGVPAVAATAHHPLIPSSTEEGNLLLQLHANFHFAA